MPLAEVNGTRLHYLDVGAGDPAVVLLHGFPLHSGMWAPQLACLSAGHRVVAPDFKGFGESDAPESPSDYSMPGYAGELAGLLDHLGLEQVVLAGLSMGGYAAFAFLREHRDRVAGLVLADTRAAPDTPEVFERRTKQQDEVAREGTAGVAETLLAGLLCDETKAHRLELVEQVRRLMANPAAGYVGGLEAMKHRPDATAELAAISVPTLVVVGEHDGASPPDVARAMHEAVAGSRLAVLPHAGHLSNLEAADDFNAAVADLLDGM